ncbi:MAG TPA: helix-hairpin-helix domain-containing protein [Nitrospiraceae bacterium]|nr:helix-hairpin-helix domain-containing protein [Nitrospiraceae bacterium]
MLAVTATLVLWIGWPGPKEPATDPPPTAQEHAGGPQGTTQNPSVSDWAVSSHAVTEGQRTSQTVVIPTTKGTQRLDINRATIEELQGLPGIGEVLARRVVERRRARGSFHTVEDLLEVKGIGEKRLNSLRPLILVGNQTKAPGRTTKSAEAPALQEKGRL